MSFIQELKRRKVMRVALAYGVVGWLLVEVASVLFPTFTAPAWVMKVFVTLIFLGFPLAVFLAWAIELTPDGLKKEKGVDRPLPAASQTGEGAPSKPTEAGARPTPRSPRQRIRSLVVLPLTNLSCDPEQEYFADGMTEALIANLAKLRALRIISRTSAMCYKGSTSSLPEIAEELDVDAVVEGSVLRVGQRVRITIQLIRAATDTHLWAESYERDMQDVLLLQSEVAQAVAREIQVAVTPQEKKHLTTTRRVNPQAYEAYLKGRFHQWQLSPQDLDKKLGSKLPSFTVTPTVCTSLHACPARQAGFARTF